MIERVPNAVCNVAMVGAGYMAREHLRAFQSLPGVRLTGIHSRTHARAEALAREFALVDPCDSIAELFERSRADLVVVAVSELAMSDLARQCLAFPWVVVLEKPPALCVREAEELARLAARYERKAHVALNRRFYASTVAVQADLADRSGPRFLQILDQEDRQQAVALGFPERVVQRWMYANSIHVIDYLRVFGRGAVTDIERVLPWNPDTAGPVVARIAFDSGDAAVYEAVWDGPGPWSVCVTTPQRRWELRPLEKASYQDRGQRQLQTLSPDADDVDFKPGLRKQAAAALAVVRNQSTALPTIAEAVETMRLIEEIYRHE